MALPSICVALYDAIIKLRPDWHSDEDDAGVLKVVMTGSASDPEAWQAHIGKEAKARRTAQAKAAGSIRAGSGNLNNWDKCIFCLRAA